MELIKLIDKPNQTICRKFLEDNKDRLEIAKGSATKHQAWPGGYVDHINEVMNIGSMLYAQLTLFRKLPFSLSDALLTLFLHDLEKPWKHIPDGIKNRVDFSTFEPPNMKEKAKEFRKKKIEEYGFKLTDEHWNALKYVEGENEDYHPTLKMQGPLAAFIHCCDTISARIWFDQPGSTFDGPNGLMSEQEVREYSPIDNEKTLYSMREFARILKHLADDYVEVLDGANSFTNERHTIKDWLDAFGNYTSW